MADFYLDHGAYGLASNRIGLDAPTTWGVPQEGDGTEKTASTAASVAEILINAVPTASETIVIAGATITAAAALGTNTFARGATTADTATNIVALINHASNFTNTVGTSVVRTTGITTNANQGRNLFYARVKPGQSSTVQIMFCIGSTALDHANNTNVAITTSGWGTAPTITQFTGGVSGCFGWFINTVALGRSSSLAVNSYGALMSNPTVVKSGASSVYTTAYPDRIYVRTGSGQQVAVNLGTSNVARLAAATNTYHFVFDSNTQWTGDSGTGVFELRVTNTSTFTLTFAPLNSIGGRARFQALRQGGFKVTSYTTGASLSSFIMPAAASNGEALYENCTFEEDPSGTAGLYALGASGNLHVTVSFHSCVFNYLKASAVGRTVFPWQNIAWNRHLTIRNCVFNFNYTGVAAPTVGIVTISGSLTSFDQTVIVSGGRVTGLGAYSQPFVTLSAGWSVNETCMTRVFVEGVSGAEVGVSGLAPWQDWSPGNTPFNRTIFTSSPGLGGAWRLETSNGAADWVPGQGLPTLGGLSPGGIAVCQRVFWLPSVGQGKSLGFTAPALRQQSRGSDGTKTIVLEMLVPSAITYDFADIRFELQYVDTSGIVQLESKTGNDIVSSAQSWTNAGSYPGHTAKKVTFTTAQAVKQYTDVNIEVTLLDPCPTGSLAYLFFDPGFSIT